MRMFHYLVVMLLAAWPVGAQVIPGGGCGTSANPCTTTTTPSATTPLGYCALTPSAATGLASCAGGIPATATTVVVRTETQSVRFRDDGTAPTSSVGWLLDVGAVLTYKPSDLTKIQFIQTAVSATVDVDFYK